MSILTSLWTSRPRPLPTFKNRFDITDYDTVITDADRTEHAALIHSSGRIAFSESSAEHSRAKRKLRIFWVCLVVADKHKAWLVKNDKHLSDTHESNQSRTFKFQATRMDAVAIKSIGRGACVERPM